MGEEERLVVVELVKLILLVAEGATVADSVTCADADLGLDGVNMDRDILNVAELEAVRDAVRRDTDTREVLESGVEEAVGE